MCLFRNLANLGKSRSLDTEEAECSALTSCPHPAEASCRTCAGDSARDLELNKVNTEICSYQIVGTFYIFANEE